MNLELQFRPMDVVKSFNNSVSFSVRPEDADFHPLLFVGCSAHNRMEVQLLTSTLIGFWLLVAV